MLISWIREFFDIYFVMIVLATILKKSTQTYPKTSNIGLLYNPLQKPTLVFETTYSGVYTNCPINQSKPHVIACFFNLCYDLQGVRYE